MAESIEQLDAFMEAIRRQESGNNYTVVNSDSGAYGAYQFMKGTYVGAAKLAGVSTAWPPSKANQDAAARALMTKYFEQTGSWQKVSQFWYAGPGSAKYSQAALTRKQGGGKYPSILDYSMKAVNAMNSIYGGTDSGGSGETPTGSPPTAEEVEQQVREEYPEYAFLLDDPEIKKTLLEAVDPDGGLDDAAFMARIRKTQWYQTNGTSARQWEALLGTDPASAARALDTKLAELRSRATALGVTASDEELKALADRALRFNLNDAEMSVAFAELMVDDTVVAGAVASTMTQLRSMARQFVTKVDENELTRWAKGIAAGTASADDFQNSLRTLAKAKFSGNEQLVSMIDQGMSPEAFFADHKSLIASEFDLSPEQVDLTDTKWQGALQMIDGGKIRPMTLDETRQYVRRQDGWEKTTTGQQKISEMGKMVGEIFGKAKY